MQRTGQQQEKNPATGERQDSLFLTAIAKEKKIMRSSSGKSMTALLKNLRQFAKSPGRFHPDAPKYHPHPVGDCGSLFFLL